MSCGNVKTFVPISVMILAFLILFGLLFATTVRGDVSFINGASSPVAVTGSVAFTLQPGQSFTFVPSSTATNGIEVNGAPEALVDGTLYSINSDGTVSVSPVLRNNYDDDSVLASYFINGLEMGTGLAAVLFGWLAVKRGLRLGDVWTD
jgi:hypothetical protein